MCSGGKTESTGPIETDSEDEFGLGVLLGGGDESSSDDEEGTGGMKRRPEEGSMSEEGVGGSGSGRREDGLSEGADVMNGSSEGLSDDGDEGGEGGESWGLHHHNKGRKPRSSTRMGNDTGVGGARLDDIGVRGGGREREMGFGLGSSGSDDEEEGRFFLAWQAT